MDQKQSSIIIVILLVAVVAVIAATALVVQYYLPAAPEPTAKVNESPAVTEAVKVTQVPETEAIAVPTEAPEGYFKDALFIGDSRTVGLEEFGGITDARYFATIGLGITFASYSSAIVNGIGNITISSVLDNYTYGKIYVMLGINEIGGSLDSLSVVYKELLDKIRSYQPDAVIYILANIHVSTEYAETGGAVNNENLDIFNGLIAEYADSEHIFYLDANKALDDASGALAVENTYDGIHLTEEAYLLLADWLSKNAIVKN